MKSFGVISEDGESLKLVRYSLNGQERITEIQSLVFENLIKLNKFCYENNTYVIKKCDGSELLPEPILDCLNSMLVSDEPDLIVLPYLKIYKKDITFFSNDKVSELPIFTLLINPKNFNLLQYIFYENELFKSQLPHNIKLNIYFYNVYSLIVRQNENESWNSPPP